MNNPTPKKISASNTKNEILKAYDELLKQLKEKQSPDPQKEMAFKRKNEILKEVSEQSDEKIIQQISSLKVELNSSLDTIEDQLRSSHRKLKNMHDAIQIQEDRLAELYQINQEADSLAALLAAQKSEKTRFEDFMADQKDKWNKEQANLEALRKEEEESLKKNRKREDEEYNYSLQQKRKKESDLYEEKKNKLEKELKDRKESFEKEIKEREQAVTLNENELQDLRKQAADFPVVVKKEVDLAVKTTEMTLKKEHEHQQVLMQKEYESELKLQKQTIDNLLSRIKDLELQIKQAYAKMDLSEKNVKDITLKAIDSNAVVRASENQRIAYESKRIEKEGKE